MQFNDWAPEYANGLSNHLPMAIHSLQKMQATDQQIKRFYQHESAKLDKLDYCATIPPIKNWQDVEPHKGQFSHFLALRSFFSEQIDKDPQHPIIAHFIKKLAPALSCAAFHPVIRLAHAIEAQNSDEVTNALAYWVYAYNELSWPDNNAQSDHKISITIERLLEGHPWPTGRLGSNMVTSDMQAVSEQANFNQLSFKPDINKIKLAEMEQSILKLYLTTDDFTILHGVTGAFAVRIINDHFPTIEGLMLYLWQGLVTAFLSKGLTKESMQQTRHQLENITCYEPQEIRQLACDSLNDHTIKLASVCLTMHQLTADKDYLLAISRKLQAEAKTS